MSKHPIIVVAALLAVLAASPVLAETEEDFAMCYKTLASQDYQRCILYCSVPADDEEIDPLVRSAAMSNRGICNEFTGNLRRALEDQTDAIELWEGNASAYANRSFLFVKTGELGHAKKDASRARELDPSCRIPEF